MISSERPNIPVFNWAIDELTVEERTASLKQTFAHIEPLLKPGMRVLDLCCGSGAAAFLCEERGAQVTAVDLADSLLEMGRAEAARRGSAVQFIHADALKYDLGERTYELVLVLGNPLLDFPHAEFAALIDRLHRALVPDGHLILEFHDGIRRLRHESEPPERVTQEQPEKMSRRFIKYDPAQGAFLVEYHNHNRNETRLCQGFIYTAPLVRLLLAPHFELIQANNLNEHVFLDIYQRKNELS